MTRPRFKFAKLGSIGKATNYGTFSSLVEQEDRAEDRFGYLVYSHFKWGRLTKKLRAIHKTCQLCGASPKEGYRLYCDHKIELKDLGVHPLDLVKHPMSFSEENIQVICHTCHQIKGREAQKKRSLEDLQRIRRYEEDMKQRNLAAKTFKGEISC